MYTFLRDVAYAARNLRKSPGLTIAMVLALAVGLAVNASAFLFVHALVLKPLPFRELGTLMTVWESPVNANERGAMAPANYLDIRQENRCFERMTAYRGWEANLTGVDDPERIMAFWVSDGFFQVLGMNPEQGRTFLGEEFEGGARHVVVVSDGFWKRRMGSEPDAVGRSISINGQAYTVVGIMPSDFNFPLETDVWAPLVFTGAEKHDRSSHDLAVLARLKPGVPVAQARAELSGISRRLSGQYPDTNENRGARVVPILEMINNVTDRFCMILFATAAFVLLLACANTGNLLLVRLAGRQREVAVRTALGAGRGRIIGQLVAESLLLSAVAGVVGVVLAAWNLGFSNGQIPPIVLRWVAGARNLHMSWTVIGYLMAASVVVGFLCAVPGIVQVLRGGTGLNLMDGLKDGGRGGSAGQSRARLRSALAVFEVVLALVLMIGAGVMVRTFNRLLALNPGYNTQNLLNFQVTLPPDRYPDPVLVSAFYENLRTGLEDVPSAASAAVVTDLGGTDGVWIEGRPEPRSGEPRPFLRAVSPQFFRTMELPMVAGRPIADQDSKDTEPVIVLSESVVRHYWPDGNAVGARVRLHKSDSRRYRVVGVSGNLHDWFFGTQFLNGYVPFSQAPRLSAGVFVRTSGDPMRAVGAVRQGIRKLDRSQPIFDLKTVEQMVAEQTSGVRISAVTMSIYGTIALLLAVTGIYAIIAHSVEQRTLEIGIRIALGADRRTILQMTLSDAMRIGGLGLAIGIPAAFVLLQVMSSVLYGVVRPDALTFTGGVAALAASAIAAGYVPALRAARVDPAIALRNE